MSTTQRIPRGLTLVELLVAVSIMVLLLSLAGMIFSDTTQAISNGLQNSDILATNSTIGDQLERDFKHLIPPGDEHPRGFLVIINQQIDADHKVLDAQGYERDSRAIDADQIGFLVRYPESHSLHSMTSQNPTGSDAHYRTALQSTDARVWYGHLSPTTLSDGDLPEMIHEWSLGRQALLFNNRDADDRPLTKNVTVPGKNSALRKAHTDYVNMTLLGLTGYKADDPDNDPQIAPDTDQDYLDRMFTGSNRLRVRQTWDDNFTPTRFGQLHAHLANGCSDFNVQYAMGDDSGGVERDGDGIDWQSDGRVFRYNEPDNWPKLIRIRYRLHDKRGELRSADGPGTDPHSGRWYEHVMKVPQP